MKTRYDDWLEISTTGFAQRQADRLPAHLLKEVIQNALDAVEDLPKGIINITIVPDKIGRKTFVKLHVIDNGPGINDPKDLRTVFSTGKTDTFLLRGRLGQGLKEILCLCHQADIRSSEYTLEFRTEKDGRRTCSVESGLKKLDGTSVMMWLPWDVTVIPDLVQYCERLIVPARVKLIVNQQTIRTNLPVRKIDVELKTELFNDDKWVRRERAGTVELFALNFPGEEPKIFEMGIPVQDIDWTQPYHVNVLMRVPMNPRRDAVASGYLKDLYRQVLPQLLPDLEPEQLRDEWVSQAVEDAPTELRREIVTAAFGTDAVRSVPTLGRYDFDADAREMGLTPIDTRLLPKGLREATAEFMQTSRDVELARRERVNIAFTQDSNLSEDDAVRAFVSWLAQQLVEIPVVVSIVDQADFIAAWGGGGRMTLNRQCRDIWLDPLSERFLGVLVHECAHEKAGHHGDDFRKEVERMAGKLARICLQRSGEIIEKWSFDRDCNTK